MLFGNRKQNRRSNRSQESQRRKSTTRRIQLLERLEDRRLMAVAGGFEEQLLRFELNRGEYSRSLRDQVQQDRYRPSRFELRRAARTAPAQPIDNGPADIQQPNDGEQKPADDDVKPQKENEQPVAKEESAPTEETPTTPPAADPTAGGDSFWDARSRTKVEESSQAKDETTPLENSKLAPQAVEMPSVDPEMSFDVEGFLAPDKSGAEADGEEKEKTDDTGDADKPVDKKPISLPLPEKFEGSHDLEYRDEGATCKDEVDQGPRNRERRDRSRRMSSDRYRIRYDCDDVSGNQAQRPKRPVVIQDHTRPQIQLIQPGKGLQEAGFPYTDRGAEAKDSLDGESIEPTDSGANKPAPAESDSNARGDTRFSHDPTIYMTEFSSGYPFTLDGGDNKEAVDSLFGSDDLPNFTDPTEVVPFGQSYADDPAFGAGQPSFELKADNGNIGNAGGVLFKGRNGVQNNGNAGAGQQPNLKAELRNAQDKAEKAQKAVKDAENKQAEIDNELNQEENQPELDKLNSELKNLNDRITKLEEKLKRLEKNWRSQRRRYAVVPAGLDDNGRRTYEDADGRKNQMAAFNEKQGVENELKELKKKRTELEEQKGSTQKRVDTLKTEKGKADQTLKDAKKSSTEANELAEEKKEAERAEREETRKREEARKADQKKEAEAKQKAEREAARKREEDRQKAKQEKQRQEDAKCDAVRKFEKYCRDLGLDPNDPTERAAALNKYLHEKKVVEGGAKAFGLVTIIAGSTSSAPAASAANALGHGVVNGFHGWRSIWDPLK